MAEPLRHRQTKGAETDMPSLPPPRHIPTLPRLCENLVICLISSGKGRYGHGVQRLAHLVGGSSQDRQLQSRRPAAVLSGLPQAIATPVARLERSMSGMITAEMAAIAPREVERLALIAPAFLRRRPGANSRAYWKFESSPLQQRVNWFSQNDLIRHHPSARFRGFCRYRGVWGRAVAG